MALAVPAEAYSPNSSKPENQVAELTLRRGRIAQCRGEIVAENDAHADAGAAHADTGNACPDVFRGGRIHDETPFLGWQQSAVSGRGVLHH
jgi:hypothetical protein